MLMLEGFQAGLAWIVILRKRQAFRKAFAGFGEDDVARLMADAGVVRAQAKIRATITGARIYCDMAGHGESFAGFCWSFTDGRTIQGSGRPRMDHKLAAVEDKSKEMKRWLSSSSGLDRRRSPAGQWSYALLTCPPTHCAGLLAGQVCYVGLPGVCCYCTASHRLIVSRRRLASSKSRASVAASIFWRSVSKVSDEGH